MIMESIKEALGIKIPEVLLPAPAISLEKWAVVACDQFTSQPEYWDQVEKFVGDSPSALELIFPEIYLGCENDYMRIEKINRTMQEYISNEYFSQPKQGFILVDRKTPHAESRKGLITALDLEKYDYEIGSQTLIRATEGTVIERLPPRIKIRENAPIEMPHIMVLIDDPGRTVIEPIASDVKNLQLVYDFELMLGGGHIKGYTIEAGIMTDRVLYALEKLADPDSFKNKYGVTSDKGVLLFAVGDGNHSLATAKACWEKLKKSLTDVERQNHPARYALVELVNVHDDGLKFEPIHRVVFNIDPEKLLKNMVEFYIQKGCRARLELGKVSSNHRGAHILPFISKSLEGRVVVENQCFNLEVGTLQCFLDELTNSDKNIKIDYIHGHDAVTRLGSVDGNIGFYLPPMSKHDLFKTVIMDGVLPRKTFSMGEAMEKRYYLECRKILASKL